MQRKNNCLGWFKHLLLAGLLSIWAASTLVAAPTVVSILYRVDNRSPAEVLAHGFTPWGGNRNLRDHLAWTAVGYSQDRSFEAGSAYISLTSSYAHMLNSLVLMAGSLATREHPGENRSVWVYAIQAGDRTFDLNDARRTLARVAAPADRAMWLLSADYSFAENEYLEFDNAIYTERILWSEEFTAASIASSMASGNDPIPVRRVLNPGYDQRLSNSTSSSISLVEFLSPADRSTRRENYAWSAPVGLSLGWAASAMTGLSAREFDLASQVCPTGPRTPEREAEAAICYGEAVDLTYFSGGDTTSDSCSIGD